MDQMRLGIGMLGTGVLAWALFTSLAIAIFFTHRIIRELRVQGKPLDHRSVIAAFSSEYARSDIYGATVSWIGCVVTVVVLVVHVVHGILPK
jgi:hypothetical protein